MAREAAISLTALFGRIFWMMIGPIFLMVLALGIAQQRDGWFAPTDFLYFLVLGGMLFGRHTEFRYGDPLTSPLFLIPLSPSAPAERANGLDVDDQDVESMGIPQ